MKVKRSFLALCLLINIAAVAQEWNTDLETAKRKAAAANKNILLVFSGSDWCARCMELEKYVWQTEEFKAEAPKNWILLRADFLQKKGMPEPVDVNDMKIILAEKYNRNGFFPYIVLLDRYGKILAKSGMEEVEKPEDYLSALKKLGH